MTYEMMDEQISSQLNVLIKLLEKDETIQRFKQIEARVKKNQSLKILEEAIKTEQKNAVQCAHYGKLEAEKISLKKADELKEEYETHPLVLAYREALIEANDLVQHVTSLIQHKVNEKFEEEGI